MRLRRIGRRRAVLAFSGLTCAAVGLFSRAFVPGLAEAAAAGREFFVLRSAEGAEQQQRATTGSIGSDVRADSAPRRVLTLVGAAAAALALGELSGGSRSRQAGAQGSFSVKDLGGPPALASAVFSAGDARFVQGAFEDIRYKGITNIEVGRMDDGTRAVRVTYNPKRCTYKALLGAFWRNHNPTDAGGQFDNRGSEFRPVIWVANAAEQDLATTSSKLMEASGVYGPISDKGYLKGGKQSRRQVIPFVTEVRIAGTFTPVPEDGQDFITQRPSDYKELNAKSGREKFFSSHFDAVNTTECEGGVCGYVYFPCTPDNQCTDVTSGNW